MSDQFVQTRGGQAAPSARVPFGVKFAYGMGAFVNNLLSGCLGAMLIVLNLGLGMDPVVASLVASLPRLFDAFTDPLMGYISDNTRSRWGRRRPYIFVGALVTGLLYMALWQLPAGQSQDYYFWYFLVGSVLFFLAYTVFATPWVALGYELTDDYDERSRLMGTQFFIGQLAYFIPPWLLLIMENDSLFGSLREGAAGVAIVIGVFTMAVGVLPAIFIREKVRDNQPDTPETAALSQTEVVKRGGISNRTLGQNAIAFGKSLWTTVSFVPFLKLCAATFLVFNGFIMIASFQSYVVIYYMFGGDKAAAGELLGVIGSVQTFSTFAVIAIVTWLSTHFGKRRAFFISIGISAVGYASKWFLYIPEVPWLAILPAPLIAFGLGGLFTLMPSMMADIVDWDELRTGERREGSYGSIYWWIVKLGQSAALIIGGVLLKVSGFDVALEGAQTEETLTILRFFDAFFPAAISLLAIYIIFTFRLTRDKAAEIRAQLDARKAANQST